MPGRTWTDVTEQELGEACRDGDGYVNALLLWALWAVDGLHYLRELYHEIFAVEGKSQPASAGTRLLGYHQDNIELSYIRWATTTAVTALDLCAAALARIFIGRPTPTRKGVLREADIGDLDPASAKKNFLRLPVEAQTWIKRVVDDPRWAMILGTRHPLSHALLSRHISVMIGDPTIRPRLSIPIGSRARASGSKTNVPSSEILDAAAALSADHVGELLNAIIKGRLPYPKRSVSP